MTDKIDALLAWPKWPAVRRWAYGVYLAVTSLLLAVGWISPELKGAWDVLGLALLGLALVNVTDVGSVEEYDPKHDVEA